MRPNYIVIGSMKSATSTICAYLEDHPQAFMVERGEPNYFSLDENWAQGEAWYLEKFAAAQNVKVSGEGSNNYSNIACFPHSAERMAQFNPAMKIIYMVRDPIERIRSDYIQRRNDFGDKIPGSLLEAARSAPEIFIDQSLYWKQISAYRAHFPDDQIFIGFMEDLSADRGAFLARLTDFLGIDRFQARRGHQNPSKDKRVPSPVIDRMKAMPLGSVISLMTPSPVKKLLKQRLLSRPAAEVKITPDVYTYLADILREDSRQILAFCGKPAHFWGHVQERRAA